MQLFKCCFGFVCQNCKYVYFFKVHSDERRLEMVLSCIIMGKFIYISLLLVVLFQFTLSAEKVLFGEPAPIGAESRQSSPDSDAVKDVTPKDGRKARVFTFPGSSSSQQQDSRTHQPAYVISSPYEETQDRFSQASSAAAVADENRLLSLLPTFGSNGMQVGLDFKLPFFSIPYAKMFSALSSPSVGSGIFGGGLPFGGSPSISTGTLASNLLGTGSGLTSSAATMAAMAVTAALLYPKVSNIFSLNSNSFRDGGGADDFFHNVNSVLNQFNIDGESCMKVALCSLGTSKRYQQRTRDGSTTPADVVEDILNLPAVKKLMTKGTLTQARDFGGSGGDCEYFNDQSKCPIAAETFQKMLSNLG